MTTGPVAWLTFSSTAPDSDCKDLLLQIGISPIVARKDGWFAASRHCFNVTRQHFVGWPFRHLPLYSCIDLMEEFTDLWMPPWQWFDVEDSTWTTVLQALLSTFFAWYETRHQNLPPLCLLGFISGHTLQGFFPFSSFCTVQYRVWYKGLNLSSQHYLRFNHQTVNWKPRAAWGLTNAMDPFLHDVMGVKSRH